MTTQAPQQSPDTVSWDEFNRMAGHIAHLLATLRIIADGEDDPAWMRVKARKAIREVTQ